MATKLQLTGLATYSHNLLYGQSLRKDQVILHRDDEGAALQAMKVPNSNTNVFTTLTGAEVVTFDLTDKTPDQSLVVVEKGNVTLSLKHHGKRVEMLAASTITVDKTKLPKDFYCDIVPTTGTTTVAVAAGTKINGGTANVTRALAQNPQFRIQARAGYGTFLVGGA